MVRYSRWFFFEETQPLENTKCELASYALEDVAEEWLQQLQHRRLLDGESEIKLWPRMKFLLSNDFWPTKCLIKCSSEVYKSSNRNMNYEHKISEGWVQQVEGENERNMKNTNCLIKFPSEPHTRKQNEASGGTETSKELASLENTIGEVIGLGDQTVVSNGLVNASAEDGPCVMTLNAPSYMFVAHHAKNGSVSCRENMFVCVNHRCETELGIKENSLASDFDASANKELKEREPSKHALDKEEEKCPLDIFTLPVGESEQNVAENEFRVQGNFEFYTWSISKLFGKFINDSWAESMFVDLKMDGGKLLMNFDPGGISSKAYMIVSETSEADVELSCVKASMVLDFNASINIKLKISKGKRFIFIGKLIYSLSGQGNLMYSIDFSPCDNVLEILIEACWTRGANFMLL